MFTVAAEPSFNVLEDTLQVTLSPARQQIIPLTLINTGTETLTLEFDASNLDLTDKDGDRIRLSFNPAEPTLQPGENVTIQVLLDSDRSVSFENFGGQLRVQVVNNSAVRDTVNLDIQVQPDVCDFGAIGTDLEVKIEDPNSGNDFKPGEEMPIEIKVKNVGINSVRVKTEAFLFSKSRNIEDAASETKTIEDDDDYTFKISMVIPANPDEISKDESLRLVVKAFDDENERRNCAIDTISLDIKLKDKEVTIDNKESRLFPEVAACGDVVKGYVGVRNIGAKDNEKVTVSITNNELGINTRSDAFSLDRFSDSDRSKAIRQFDIAVPDSAQEKTYALTARVDYEGGSQQINLPLQVVSCQQKNHGPINFNPVLIRPLQDQVHIAQGKSITLPVQITNLLNQRSIYTLVLTNIGEVGQSGSKTITVNPGQITTAFLELTSKEDAEPGVYSGSIVVKQGAATLASQTFIIEILAKNPEKQKSSTIESIPLVVWIVLLILALGAISLAGMATMQQMRHQRR